MNAIDCFCELLAARLTLTQGALPGLAALDAVWRADALFEAGADLSDSLLAFERDLVGSDTVREGALRVAALACQLYLATTGGGLAESIGEVTDNGR
jgi:hypothetical protein